MARDNWAAAIVDFIDDGDRNRGHWERLAASFFGSFLLHLAVLIALGSHLPTLGENLLLAWLAFTIVVSTLFTLVIATGRKGGLIRRFWYGLSLPAVCYAVAMSLVGLNVELSGKIDNLDNLDKVRVNQSIRFVMSEFEECRKHREITQFDECIRDNINRLGQLAKSVER